MQVKDFLIISGVFPNIRGFKYVVDAVKLAKCEDSIGYIYKRLAEKYNSTWTRVERAMRHAISKIPLSKLNMIGMAKVPTNGQFIYYFAQEDVRK